MSATLDKIIEEVRLALSHTIRGKYRDVLSSSEEFIARKAVETAREDRARDR